VFLNLFPRFIAPGLCHSSSALTPYHRLITSLLLVTSTDQTRVGRGHCALDVRSKAEPFLCCWSHAGLFGPWRKGADYSRLEPSARGKERGLGECGGVNMSGAMAACEYHAHVACEDYWNIMHTCIVGMRIDRCSFHAKRCAACSTSSSSFSHYMYRVSCTYTQAMNPPAHSLHQVMYDLEGLSANPASFFEQFIGHARSAIDENAFQDALRELDLALSPDEAKMVKRTEPTTTQQPAKHYI